MLAKYIYLYLFSTCISVVSIKQENGTIHQKTQNPEYIYVEFKIYKAKLASARSSALLPGGQSVFADFSFLLKQMAQNEEGGIHFFQ